MNPRLDVPDLQPPSVLWTLLESDPLPAFRERLSRRPMFTPLGY
jgi:hypothetical protein